MIEIKAPHSLSIEEIFTESKSSDDGISQEIADIRVQQFGPNILPSKPPTGVVAIFARQFLNPLIYILFSASILSLTLGDESDAIFIGLVLLINAIIGTIQESGAEKSAHALKQMSATICRVERDGEVMQLDSSYLVPGDLVLLESGNKVPADLRLIHSHGLEIDESLLTGESLAVHKLATESYDENTALGDRKNMAFSGSMVTRGRGRGIVTSTGLNTELGKIASSLSYSEDSKPPLVIRMERFTKNIAIFFVIITAFIALILLLKGEGWHEVLMLSVALAVSAIPEGLPVALTIALSIAGRRMAKRNVIVRKLPAVEALGSCSMVATDKTGTLTVNQMTIKKIAIPGNQEFLVPGSGLTPEGEIHREDQPAYSEELARLRPLLETGVLCNESKLIQKDGIWQGHGDAVDLSFLVLAYKGEVIPEDVLDRYKLICEIPFEPENQYSAAMHAEAGTHIISIKGAVEKLLPLCDEMLTLDGPKTINTHDINKQAEELASAGYRVLALANKTYETFLEDEACDLNFHLEKLTFLGLVAMIDPLRNDTVEAVKQCQSAGIELAMITGDHPKTAFAIASELGFASDIKEVITGPELKLKEAQHRTDIIAQAKVFARVEPAQKLEIVQSLIKNGQYVAVTGDGANDAPALKMANVGIAMGKSGTDVAKETADLIITDDHFASIVAGIEEGRIAYNNIRKVVYLLISTGMAEVVLFILSIIANIPMPLTAVQLLWLNLVTNGIQDVGLAFEPGEGDELSKPPRKPGERIFDRPMLERIILTAVVMGLISFFYFHYLVRTGMEINMARNLTLLLMVLFENIMIANCRSETKSAFSINPFNNKILLFGTIGAQLLHIGVLYTPGINKVLGVMPVSFADWLLLLGLAISILVVMEIYKLIRR